jgi:hypothetical protein
MADTKITALTAIGANPIIPSTFPIPMVDLTDTSMAASGTTKKVTVNQILGAGGTATLASATITGAATVGTTLGVTGVSTFAAGTAALPALTTTGDTNTGIYYPAADTFAVTTGGSERLRIDSSGNVGIGNTPVAALDVYKTANDTINRTNATFCFGQIAGLGAALLGQQSASSPYQFNLQAANAANSVQFPLVLQPSGGNVGIGGTPNYKLQLSGAATSFATSPSLALYDTTVGSPGSRNWLIGNVAATNYGELNFCNSSAAGGAPTNVRMTLDASGNVGLGVTPSAWVSYQKAIDFGGAGNYGSVSARANFAAFATNCYFDGTNWVYKNNNPANTYEHSAGSHIWRYAAAGTGNITFTQAMTLDASGNLLIGTTTTSGNAGGLKLSNVAGNLGQITFSNNSGVADYVTRFNYGSTPTLVGTITVDSGGTTYNTTSDYRLKESVQPLIGGLARVNALKPSTYKWKADSSNGEGFLAHELAEVVPFAVSGEKDAVNEDGSIKAQGVDLSRVVPILVSAIQELTARVQTLEAK